jgi:hypothetical protein
VLRLYLGQPYQEYCKVEDKDGNMYIETNFFVYYYKMFPHLGKKLSWLWFLLALFIDSLVNYPLMAWTQRRQKKLPLDKTDLMYFTGMVFSRIIWGLICYMSPDNNGVSTSYYNLWPQIGIQFLYYCTLMFG